MDQMIRSALAENIEKLSWGDNPRGTVRSKGKQMCFISRDEEVSFSRDSTFDDAVVVLFGGDGADAFFGLNDLSDPPDGPDAGISFPCTQFKLVPEDSAELREDEWGKEEIYRLPPGQT